MNKRTLLLAALLVLQSCGLPYAHIGIVKAESYLVVDEEGEVRALLTASTDGARLSFHGKDGIGMMLGESNGTSYVTMVDPSDEGKGAILIRLGEEGTTWAQFDENGRIRVIASMLKSLGFPLVAVLDENQKVEKVLKPIGTGNPEFPIQDLMREVLELQELRKGSTLDALRKLDESGS